MPGTLVAAPRAEISSIARASMALALASVAANIGDYHAARARLRAARGAIELALWRCDHEIAEAELSAAERRP